MSTDRLMGSVAAVVVNFNAGAHLGACLRSLQAAGVSERIVVDNASADDSRRQAALADPGHRWIDSGRNLGYGGAANVGAAASHASRLLICNPDLEVGPGAVTALLARLEAEPDLGMVGPLVRNPDGTIYPSARTFPALADAVGHGLLGVVAPGNRFTRRYRLLDWDHGEAARVDWVSGACFLIRRQAWDAVGGFDPRYFMYLEDVDLCWRLGDLGWGIGFEPGAEVVHVQGVSTGLRPYRMLAAHHRSLWRFATRTTRGVRRLALPLVGAGIIARLGVAWFQHGTGRARDAAAAIGPSQPRRLP
jgi:N-acetylglucosaminyl-diphospho-decaprenol L-rhamnosyltransferase